MYEQVRRTENLSKKQCVQSNQRNYRNKNTSVENNCKPELDYNGRKGIKYLETKSTPDKNRIKKMEAYELVLKNQYQKENSIWEGVTQCAISSVSGMGSSQQIMAYSSDNKPHKLDFTNGDTVQDLIDYAIKNNMVNENDGNVRVKMKSTDGTLKTDIKLLEGCKYQVKSGGLDYEDFAQ